jgi:gliding motility-associated-like protein
LIVSNASGCSDTAYAGNYVSVFPNPTAGFTVNPNAITTGSPVITVTSESINSTNCTYYFTTGEVLTDCNAQLIFSNIDAGAYEVIQVVSNEFGCKDTATQKFIVLSTASIFVPNSFTPNDDGENDIFFARGTGIKSFLLLIYDRWGQIVATSENIDAGWDARNVAGNKVKQDLYVWKIIARDLNDELIKKTGHVTVIY